MFFLNIKRMKYYSVSFLYINVQELAEFLCTYQKYRGSFKNQLYLIDLFTSISLVQVLRSTVSLLCY